MKTRLESVALASIVLGLACGFASAGTEESGGTAMVGATIIDGLGNSLANGSVLVRDGRITCVGEMDKCSPGPDMVVHDVTGSFITPGLIDSHVHFAQTGWLDGRPDGISAPQIYPYEATVAALRAIPGRWHRSYLCAGVTAVFDVGGADWTVTDEHARDTDRTDRVHVRAAGPLLTNQDLVGHLFKPGALQDQPTFLPFSTPADARQSVERLRAIGAAAVKVLIVSPDDAELPALEAQISYVGELADAAGLPLIVHAMALEEAKIALRAGAAMLVHGVDREPLDEAFLSLLLGSGAVYAPTMVVEKNWMRALAAVAFATPLEVDDPNRCVDEGVLELVQAPDLLTDVAAGLTPETAISGLLEAGRKVETMTSNLRAVRDAGGTIVVATDAGNPLTLHGPSIYEEMESMQSAGMTPEEIIAAATVNGARAMGMEQSIGSLEAGKQADLLILQKDPLEDVANFRTLTHVMRKGFLQRQTELQVR